MFNLKWSLVSGGAAFFLSFLTGLLFGHVGILIALLRGLIFFAVFFGLGTGIWALINMFIPELLQFDTQKNNIVENVFYSSVDTDSQINITLDDSNNDAALPDSGIFSSETGDVGTFTDLVTGSVKSSNKDAFASEDIDQNPINSYNDKEGFDSAPASPKNSEFSMDFGAFGSDSNEPEETNKETDSHTDSYMDTFSSFTDDDQSEAEDTFPEERNSRENKSNGFEGDFSPKEIAAGVRTVLEKDKKG